MVAKIPQVINWSVTPQNGQVNYFTLMNTWLLESTSVIASLNTAITKINEAGQDINNIGQNAINAITLDTVDDLATYTGTGLVIVKDSSRGGTFVSKSATEINPNTGSLYAVNGGTVFAKLGGGFWVRQYNGTIKDEWFGITKQNSPFGLMGMRLAVGEKRDAHYAWGSIVEIPSSKKWVMIYRKATQHGTENGAECRAVDSYDFGVSWVNDRLVHSEATTDSRADRIALMANGRIGFFCNRASTTDNKYPLFISSDNGGITWNKLEVPTSSLTYTFTSVGGIVDFPASQGGNDSTGFVTFGYIDAGGVDAFKTTDNGNTWTIVSNVNGSTVVSENVIIRLGNTDRWLIFVRANPNLLVYATTDILNWGTAIDTGLVNLSSPPAGYYDAITNKVYNFATARTGKEIDGYTNNILYVGQDAETLWDSSGVFDDEYKSLLTTPNWTTGYLSTFSSSIGTCATFTAGENVANGLPPSSVWLIGNFETNSADIGNFVDKFTRNMREVNSLEMRAIDNLITTIPLTILNNAGTARIEQGAYRSYYNMGGGLYTHSYNNGDVLCAYNGNVEFQAANDFILDLNGIVKFKGLNYLFGNTSSKIGEANAMLHLPVSSSTIPAVRSQALGTLSSRKHYTFHHGLVDPTAEVGNISTTTTATSYNTTSDELLKDFEGNYTFEEAINIIKADPVRKFKWKSNNVNAVGWGAQTSYSVSKDLATKGGWFLDDVEVEEGTEGATYIQWGVDQSKRTPYLWTAVSGLLEIVEKLQNRITILENKYEK